MNIANIFKYFFIIIFISGCTSMNQFKPESNINEFLKAGDFIAIETMSGQRYEFTIKSITTDKIYSENVEVNISEIIKVEKKQVSLLKTGGLTLGVWVGLSIILLSCCLIVA